MPDERFDISFSGQLLDGQDAEQARESIRKLFNASDEQLERLFSGKPMMIKKGVDIESASRYRVAFRKAGALINIRPSSASSTPGKAKRPAAKAGLSLLPLNTGSLEQFAPRIEPEPLPDISSLHLAAVGAEIDDTPGPEPIAITTGGLDLVAEQDWSLEDCQPELLPLPERDISHLDLAAADDESHIPPEPPPLPLPDISEMKLIEPEPVQKDDTETD